MINLNQGILNSNRFRKNKSMRSFSFFIMTKITRLCCIFFLLVSTILSAQNPGGISGTNLWLRADKGVVHTGNGTIATAWADSSGNSNDASSIGNDAIYNENIINFNPALTFDGINDRYTLPDGTLGSGDQKFSALFVSTKHSASVGFSTDMLSQGTGFAGQVISSRFDATGPLEMVGDLASIFTGNTAIIADLPTLSGYIYS